MKRGERTGNLYRRTSLYGGHVAGDGMLYDDYSEQSGGWDYDPGTVRVRMPHDDVEPEKLNGPIVCYKAGERMDSNGSS